MQNCGKAWNSSKEHIPIINTSFWASQSGQDNTYSNIKSENPVIYKFLWARNNFMCACTSACGLLRRSKWDTSRCEYFFVWNAESKKRRKFCQEKTANKKKSEGKLRPFTNEDHIEIWDPLDALK